MTGHKSPLLSWLGPLLGLLALLAAGTALALPAQTTSSDLTWQSGDQSGVLLLARARPQSMVISAPCTGGDGRIDTGEMSLTIVGALAQVDVGPPTAPTITLTKPLPAASGQCRIEAAFEAASSVVSLRSGFDFEQANLTSEEFPVVTRIIASGAAEAGGYRVNIVTRPTQSEPSTQQRIAHCVAALALLVLVARLIVSARLDRVSTGRVLTVSQIRSNISRWDVVVVAIAIASAVLTPAFLDDGWYRQVSRSFAETGNLSALYDNNGAWYPQGYWLFQLLTPLLASNIPVLVVRLVIAIIVIATWLVVRLGVLSKAGLGGSTGVTGAALVFLVGIPAWLITLRQEPIIAMLAALVLACALTFARAPATLPLLGAGMFAAAAVAGHHTGWIAALPLLALLPTLARWVKDSRTFAIRAITTAALASGATGLLLLGLDSDWRQLINSAADFSTGGRGQSQYQQFSLAREFERWSNLLSDSVHAGSAVRLLFVLIALLAAAFATAFVVANRQARVRLAVAMGALAWLGLFLTTSKWIWHIGALVPATAVLGAAAWTWLVAPGSRAPSRLGRAVAFGSLTMVVGIALAFPRGWGVGDLVTLTWPQFANFFGAESGRTALWLALAILVGMLAWFIDVRSWRNRGYAILAAGLVLMPVLATWVWLAADTIRTPGWTFLRQNLSLASPSAQCGAAQSAAIITQATAASTPAASPGIPVSAAAPIPSADPAAPANMPVAPFDGLPSWGTWPSDAPSPTGSATGSFSSPWQVVKAGTSLAVWIRSPRASAMEATVRFADAAGSEFATTPVGLPIGEYADAGDYWRLTNVTVPETAVLARVQLDDFSTRADGWAAFTSLATTQSQSFANVDPATVFASPFLALAFPCVPPTQMNDGVLAKIDYTIQPPSWQVASLAGDAIGTQVSCQIGANWCVYRMDYQQAGITRSPAQS